MWGLCFVGLLAPRPRQHGMLHPKLRLTAQEKSNRKENILLRLFTKNMRKFYARRASFGIKRSAFTWGYGGGASPHIRTASPAKPRSLYAQKSTLWDATFPVAEGVGRAAPQKLMCIAESETGRIKSDGAGKRVPTPLCWIFDCFSSAGNGLARGYVRRVRQRLPVHPDNAVPPRCRHRKVHRNRSSRPLLRPAPG